jgi:hypothetical protein
MPAARSAILPDHVLSAILTLAKRESKEPRFAFRGHDYQLQEVFSELTRMGKYPILSGFVFSDTGPEPYSPVLNESVSKLQLSGLIGRENPDYEVLFLRPAAEKFYDEILAQGLSSDDQAQLREIAAEFLNRVQVVKNAA